MPSLAELRIEYRRAALDEEQVADDPVQQFARWFDEARAAEVPGANAMTLATVTAEGRPAERMVLLKGLDATAFVFYSNADSAKGRDLELRPQAAMLFFWSALERQVRSAGTVACVAEFEAKHRRSDAISRPPQWGGFRVRPDGFEFWQERPSRFQDRIAYRRDGERWRIERLAP